MPLVEMPEFTGSAEKSLSEEQCYDLLTHIAQNPKCGDVMPGTGGVRVHGYEQDRHVLIVVVVDHPGSAAFALTGQCPPQFPEKRKA